MVRRTISRSLSVRIMRALGPLLALLLLAASSFAFAATPPAVALQDGGPVIIDFGGGSADQPPAGLDQWQARQAGADLAPDADVLGVKRAIVLRVYFDDYTATSRYTQAQVQGFFGELDTLWRNTSYDKINIDAQVSTLFELPDNRSDYIDDFGDGDLSNGGKYMKVLNDAVDNSPAGLDWTNIDAVMVVMAETNAAQFHRGQANKCNLKMGPGGSTKLVGCAIFSENPSETDRQVWGRWAHEIGHAFQEGGPAHPSNYNSEFELMDSNYPGQTGVFEKQSHTGFPGWMPPSKYVAISSGQGGETICLWAMEYNPADKPNPQAIKASITGSLYYMISVRRRVLGDDLNGDFPNGIPDEGVLIERVSEGSDPWVTLQAPPGGDRNNLWKEGQSFSNASDGIYIIIGKQANEDSYCVTVRFSGASQPDVMLYPWTSPPGDTWETTDIWVDSPVNGFGTYRYGSWNDLSGNSVPRGNGDDPAVGMANRLYARVRNVGAQAATDVVVRFEVTDPPGVGIAGASGWAGVGVVDKNTFPGLASIAPNSFVDVYVDWAPNVTLTPEQIAAGIFFFHTCVRVRIDPVAGETVLGNQDGSREQENIDYFQATEPGGGGPIYENAIRLFNDSAVAKFFYLSYENGLPTDWHLDVNGGQMGLNLGPGEIRDIPVTIKPEGAAVVGSIFGVDISASSQRDLVSDLDPRDKHIEFEPLGGARVEARVLQRTDLRCRATNQGEVMVEGELDGIKEFYDERHPPTVFIQGVDSKREFIPWATALATVDTNGQFAGDIYSQRPEITEVICLFAGTSELASSSSGYVPVEDPNQPTKTPTPTLTPSPTATPASACQGLTNPQQIPAPGLINFDDLGGGAVIRDAYRPAHGVRFEDAANTRALIYANEPAEAHSPPNAAINDAVFPASSNGIPMRIWFDEPKTHVGLFMGNGENLDIIGVLAAYDVEGTLICLTQGNAPEPHTRFIGLHDPLGRIASITLDYFETSLSESIDDLFFAPASPVLTATPTPTRTPTPTPTPTSLAVPPIIAIPYLPPRLTLPIALLPFDLSIHGIEITQGIQCFDTSKGLAGCADNSLPLVNKKDATARIYLKYTSNNGGSLSNVPVRLHIFANGVEYIASASGKARTNLDQSQADSADIYFNVNFNNDVEVGFYAEVDPNHNFSETNEGNNRYPPAGTIDLTFRKRDTLKVVGQRLRYHPSGYGGNQYAGGWAVNGGGADFFEQMLPIRNNGIAYSVASGFMDWTRSLTPCSSATGGNNQHALIQSLNISWILDAAFAFWFNGAFEGADHVYGWTPDAGYGCGHADMPVYPHAGGLGVVGIGTDEAGTDTDNPGAGALIMAHELTHDYDVKHTNTFDACGSNDSSSAFPYGSSSIQEFGFNPLTGKIYNPSSTHDIMSYCPSGGSKEGWVSPYTWNYMSTALDALAAVQPPAEEGHAVRLGAANLRLTGAEQSLEVHATLFNAKFAPPRLGEFGDLHRVKGGMEYLLPGDGYSVQLRAGDAVLYTESFGVSFESEYDGHGGHGSDQPQPTPWRWTRFGLLPGDPPPFSPDDTSQADVQLIIPWDEAATQIVLLQGDRVLDERQVSAHNPTVAIAEPAAPANWPAGSTQTVKWEGADEDGDVLSYSLLYSYDGSATWDLLATGLEGTSYEVSVDAFAGGADARFRVVATDGVNTGYAESASVTIPNKIPVITITNPSDGGAIVPGGLVVMQGTAVDLEDGTLPDAALLWSSDRQGDLGAGPSLPRSDLADGWHTLTLRAQDSAGASGQASVRIYIGHRLHLPWQRR